MELLAYVDRSGGNLSGPATKRILEREYGEYTQAVYERLAGISVARIYRFRNSEAYRKKNTSYQPTWPTPIPIGERRKPLPRGSEFINYTVARLLEKLLIEQTKSRAH